MLNAVSFSVHFLKQRTLYIHVSRHMEELRPNVESWKKCLKCHMSVYSVIPNDNSVKLLLMPYKNLQFYDKAVVNHI